MRRRLPEWTRPPTPPLRGQDKGTGDRSERFERAARCGCKKWTASINRACRILRSGFLASQPIPCPIVVLILAALLSQMSYFVESSRRRPFSVIQGNDTNINTQWHIWLDILLLLKGLHPFGFGGFMVLVWLWNCGWDDTGWMDFSFSVATSTAQKHVLKNETWKNRWCWWWE